MTDYKRLTPRCIWCGHVPSQYEHFDDHRLWCGGRPNVGEQTP